MVFVMPFTNWLGFSLMIQLTAAILFPKNGKLAFAHQNHAADSGNDASERFHVDSPEFRKKVEKMYEQWMIERRNEMLEKLKQALPSLEETRAFQMAYERHFGNCICEADPIICRLYSLTC
uniref:Uncharacterized protein n=1 Tax=Panagrolaimus sp. JU765 TaxID=591449 RepID=A0AC34QYL0_9BILA